ncbi:MAG: alpha/beta hydrolase family protein, partial [Mycobacterium sp.]
EAIYPENAFKTAWANLLYTDLVSINADINSQIPQAILTGNLFGTISESAQAVLTSSGPTALVESITAPTMLIQGIQDGLFVLEQSIQNGEILTANGVETKLIWFCGGHGLCLNPKAESQFDGVADATLTWMRTFVNGDPLTPPKNFQWFAQQGGHFIADLFPWDEGFAGPTIDAQSDGGFLPYLPLGIGGSGPSKDPNVPSLLKKATASEASNALDVLITTPTPETLIVGAPEVSFTYSGFGNAEFVYGQIVNVATGLVLGNLVKPIPVTLDGKTHTVTWNLENIAYTSPEAENAELKFQLTTAASPYARWSAWGGINVSDIEVKLPTVAPGVAERVVG